MYKSYSESNIKIRPTRLVCLLKNTTKLQYKEKGKMNETNQTLKNEISGYKPKFNCICMVTPLPKIHALSKELDSKLLKTDLPGCNCTISQGKLNSHLGDQLSRFFTLLAIKVARKCH